MNENTTNTPNANNQSNNPYIIDAPVRTIPVDYPDHNFKLEHDLIKPENRDIIQYYLAAPSLRAISEEGSKQIGTPQVPAGTLHDHICKALRSKKLTGELQKEYNQEQIRELRLNGKAEAIDVYLNSYYEVNLKSATGEMDDLLFGRSNAIEATVKVRPTGKVEQTFKIFINRPDDISFGRFTQSASLPSSITKKDTLLMEFLGTENLEALTGDEDEGERVWFQKNTIYARGFFDVFDKNFDRAENVLFGGEEYNQSMRDKVVAQIDPVLKLQVVNAMRNFI